MAAPSPRDAVRWASSSRGTLTQRRKQEGTAPGAEIWSAGTSSAPHPPPVASEAVRPLPRDAGHTKSHKHSYTGDALDRLEDWLGLKSATSSPSQGRPGSVASPGPSRTTQRGPRAIAAPAPAPTGRVDVLVHAVAPSDTLEGISLRYGADAHIVRRSNKLWPGDAVQMREQLYIPLASCRWRPAHAPSQTMQRHADGSLHAMQASHAPCMDSEWQLTSVETDELKFFAGERARPARGIPTGPMGDSGLDDLLEWQEAQRENVALQPAPPPRTLAAPTPPAAARDPTWLPNKRTLGVKAPERSVSEESSLLRLEDAAPESLTQRADLFQGTLPNTGAAAHWMRPIHESLPAHAPQARGPRPANASQMFSGVMSGRVRVEEAVSAAMNELRQAVNRGPQRPRDDNALLPW